MVFVIQWHRTQRDAAAAAVGRRAVGDPNMAGLVLTQVDLKKHAAFAYGDAGQYYRRLIFFFFFFFLSDILLYLKLGGSQDHDPGKQIIKKAKTKSGKKSSLR